MKDTLLVRRAASADLARLQAIERAAAILFPPGRIPDVDDAMPVSELQTAAAAGLLMVATAGAVVVGFAMARVLDNRLHLAVMAVHPDHGNRGLGRQLVFSLFLEAERRHFSTVTLTSFDDLPWNGPFYRSVGFRTLGDPELSPSLRNILAQESALGMVNRVAMQCEIAAVADLFHDCPASEQSIEAYLDLEDHDRDRNSLSFACRAECSDRTYWIWRYVTWGGAAAHIVVSQKHNVERPDVEFSIGCGEFLGALSTEQLVEDLLSNNF